MATKDPSSSSTLRFLAILTPPDSAHPIRSRSDPVELQESDVVWSFSLSSSANPPSISPSFPHHHHHQHQYRRFSPTKSGLSAALLDEDDLLVRQKSSVIPKEDAGGEKQYHPHLAQSAPVNIPLWPKEFCGKFRSSGDLMSIDEMHGFDGSDARAAAFEGEEEEDGEMVPPHVIVARSHVTFSVFEGRGRTLKGRDLRRVRNAVFLRTGFID